MCAPAPTPPRETSAASTATNVATAVANSYLSNFNEYGPDGSRVFEKTGTEKVYDPYTGQTSKVPTFDVTTTLSGKQQKIKDAQDRAKLNLSNLAGDQSKFLRGYMTEPFKYEVGDHERWAGNTYDRLSADSRARDEEALTARLANQGIGIGSQAYDDAMSGLYSGQQTARDRFMLDSYETGMTSAQAQRNQPINEITALLSGSQVSAPAFSTSPNQVTMPTTDNAGIIADYDQARIDRFNSGIGAISTIGGLFGLSDERVKTDKEKIGETDDGIGLYKFKFKGDDEMQIGLMAQDVRKKRPRAVTEGPDGLLRVNYQEALK